MNFKDFPQYLTNKANYHVTIGLDYLCKHIDESIKTEGLQLNPMFQRGHVWDEVQQVKYVEHILKGGKSGRDLYFNKPDWHTKNTTPYNDYVCVDGLQRITALMKFMNNEIKVFGHYFSEFDGRIRGVNSYVNWHVNDLQLENDVLMWYVEMNTGGTPHTEQEIQKVLKMINNKGR